LKLTKLTLLSGSHRGHTYLPNNSNIKEYRYQNWDSGMRLTAGST
jgi:hypothetical protein